MKKSIYMLSVLCLSTLLPGYSHAQTAADSNSQIRHVEIVTFQPGTSDSGKHFVDKSFRQAAGAFPLVKAFEWGWDDNDKSQNKHIYVTTFNNKGDLSTYDATPQHQAVTKTKAIKTITTIDYYPAKK